SNQRHDRREPQRLAADGVEIGQPHHLLRLARRLELGEQPGADRALAEEIVRWSLEQMAYYKAPGWICFVEELPLTATEKIQRGGLKDVVAKLMREGAFFDLRDLKRRQE
ncbi:MAG: hypothetical protein ACK463_02755, partial [Bradyrhizobium sp.]